MRFHSNERSSKRYFPFFFFSDSYQGPRCEKSRSNRNRIPDSNRQESFVLSLFPFLPLPSPFFSLQGPLCRVQIITTSRNLKNRPPIKSSRDFFHLSALPSEFLTFYRTQGIEKESTKRKPRVTIGDKFRMRSSIAIFRSINSRLSSYFKIDILIIQSYLPLSTTEVN